MSIIIPNLCSYFRGSVVCFDTKGDLHTTCGKRREARGERVIRLAPFNGGTDKFNPLDTISRESPMLIDSARAVAEVLVVRQGSEPDPHWNDKAVQVITAILVLVLMRFEGEDRSLNSVQEIASDPNLLASAAERLREMGGIPARMGNQLKTLFDKEQAGVLSKEGAECTQHRRQASRVFGQRTGGQVRGIEYVRSGNSPEARYELVFANPPQPAGGPEGLVTLLDFYVGADDRRHRG